MIWRQGFCGWLLAVIVGSGFAQTNDSYMIREISPCGQQMGNGISQPDADRLQPCKNPAINEVVIKRFADDTYGVAITYFDYSRSWARMLECSFIGQGRVQSGTLLISKILNEKQWSACEIEVTGLPSKGQKSAAIDVNFGSKCKSSSVCTQTQDSAGPIKGRLEKPFSPGFECKLASSDAEKLICLDWDLSELDFRLSALWSNFPEDKKDLEKLAQSQWIRARNSCNTNQKCIESAYKQRLSALCTRLGQKIDKYSNCTAL